MANTFNETIFLKKDSSMDKDIAFLKAMGDKSSDVQKKIKGSYGERQVEYQLSKANEGMFVLRDINLEYNGMTAQIDFIVITSHHCYFVECKNYSGNIEVNRNGEFVLNTKPGKKNGKVGIKSPLYQVEDQLELFKSICLQDVDKTKQLLHDIKFKDYFRTLVVFTNPENIIKASYAPNSIRSRLIKVDGIVRYIKMGSELYKGKRLNKAEMQAIGEFFLEKNVEKKYVAVTEEELNDLKESINSKNGSTNSFNSKMKKVEKRNELTDEILRGIWAIIIAIALLAYIAFIFRSR